MPIQFSPSHWERTWTHRRGVEGRIKGAILAAGLGKRMDPLTARHLPKPLFPLGGKVPMAEVWVRRLVASGVTDISMNLCVLKDTIKRHFRGGSKFGARITYVEEDTPSGTFGGVCKQVLGREAKELSPGENAGLGARFGGSTVIVPSGDIVTNFGSALLEEMYEIHARVGAAITLVLVPIPPERRKDYGTVILDAPERHPGLISSSGRVVEFREKDPDSPSILNNASIYMIDTAVLEELDRYRTATTPDGERPFYDFGKHVFPALLGKLPWIPQPSNHLVWGLQYDGSWFDVGRKRDYIQVNQVVLDGQLDIKLPYESLPWGFLGAGVVMDFSKVTIIPPVVIGNHCIIGRGVTLGPYAVIGDGWILEDGVTVRNSILWERYSYFRDDDVEVSPRDRTLVDRHEVRRGVTIDQSIVAGGAIEQDLVERTVDVMEDGELGILPIDYVPAGPRP